MTSRIIDKIHLGGNVWRIKLAAPLIARERKAGQFVILRVDPEWGERIPLTIADADEKAGTIDVIFQVAGASTESLARLESGDELADLAGPLGRPSVVTAPDDCAKNRVIIIGGGVGVAPAHSVAQAMKAAGNRVTSIIGARTAEMVIMEEELRLASDELIVVTDDGSYGRKGLVTAPLGEILAADSASVREVVMFGPPMMMKSCAEATRPFGVKTTASLTAVMIDGTGMCGGCRVTVGGETRFVCVDGPEFDAHKVDFDNMIRRLSAFSKEEYHKCRSGIFG